MRIDCLLLRLDHVRQTARGWIARCPAHDDRNPSLSIREGDRGLLLKCFAGCTLSEIVSALGLSVRDLFCDTQQADPQAWREAQQQRRAAQQRREQQAHRIGLATDVQREADRLIWSARNLDINAWSEAQLDAALNRLADAYALVGKELTYERT